MDPKLLTDLRWQLLEAFAHYIVDHPEVDDLLPPKSQIFFEVAGEDEFNHYERQWAEKCQPEEGYQIVFIKTKGLSSPECPRLIDPVIETMPVPVEK